MLQAGGLLAHHWLRVVCKLMSSLKSDTRKRVITPEVGMTLAFKSTSSEPLVGIPARVVDVWPRFPSGEYLVTLEYTHPVEVRGEWITCIDAFMSELCQPKERQYSRAVVKKPIWSQ